MPRKVRGGVGGSFFQDSWACSEVPFFGTSVVPIFRYSHICLWAYSPMGIPTYPDIGMEAVRALAALAGLHSSLAALAGLHSSLAALAGLDSLHYRPEDAQEVPPPLPDIDAAGADGPAAVDGQVDSADVGGAGSRPVH